MFKLKYELFGEHLITISFDTDYSFIKEAQTYDYIKNRLPYWKVERIDTTDQRGFPDLLCKRGPLYMQIECKLLKKKKLYELKQDLEWQFGQIAYLKKALARGEPSVICVAKDKTIAFIGPFKTIKRLAEELKI